MVQETSLSNPHEEEPLTGDASGGDISHEEPQDRPTAPVVEHAAGDEVSEEASCQSEVTPPPSTPGRDRGRIVALGAMGALVAVGIGLIIASPRKGAAPPPSVALTSVDLGSDTDAGEGKPQAGLATSPAVVIAPIVSTRPAPAWRVASLKLDASVEVIEGTFGKNGFVQALTRAGVSRAEIKRIAHAFVGVRRIDRPSATDTFVVAKDKDKGVVVAFEYASSPMDVWQVAWSTRHAPPEPAQARADDTSAEQVAAKKLDMFVEHKRVASGLVVGADLAKAISAAGLRPEIVEAVDDALEGHVEPGGIRAGVRMRIAATEDWVDGTFARVKVDAIEFVPKSGSPLRIYYYERDSSVEGSARRAPLPGFYDAKGKQPYRGAFRSPLPLARVTSRFNPKRMHPVLKVIMPHQGVDYGASTGTPVYASASGNVVTAGNGGPCGNMVEIEHGGGINTVYCHLKAFAQGLHSGQKVEARQLVGYVGQTGRVTGPHLHFGVKKHGMFIDPLGLKMDGVRVLPPADRDAFARKRADFDAIIDGVPLPSAADVPEENDDKDLHAE